MTDTPPSQERPFDDLTLAEMIRQLIYAPRTTFSALREILSAPMRQPARMVQVVGTKEVIGANGQSIGLDTVWAVARGILWLIAVAAAVLGCLAVAHPIFDNGRLGLLDYTDVREGLSWWIPAIFLGMLAEGAAWLGGLMPPAPKWGAVSGAMPFRWFAFAAAFPFMAQAYLGQGANEFTFLGVLGWVLSLIALSMAFWPRQVDPRQTVIRLITSAFNAPRKKPLVVLGLLAVMLIAGYMRFAQLDAVPYEMTSDHIEKLLDAQRVKQGARDIFFANNGGREPFQMYFVAFLSPLTGGLNFNTLKLAAAIESLAGIFVFFFLGRAIIGQKSRQADAFGLLLALMAAVGYWHLVVTRVSLRIMLTPLITSLLLWVLIRLIRWNRRGDAIWAGLLLGAGLYAYQALRLLPLVAGLAVLIGLIFVAKTWRQRLAYVLNLGVMAAISFAVFVPLLRFANDYPDDFWRRASGRLLGEDVICDYDDKGGCLARTPTLNERIEALSKNIHAINQNMAAALGMFTYRGDVAWFHNASNYPVFDPLSGGLLLVGLGAATVWGFRRRDAVPLFLIITLLVMLIPSASAIANVIENPSNTRASGAMPSAYFLAAFGLFGLITAISKFMPSNWRTSVGILMAAGVAFLSGTQAHAVLFGPYNDYYQNSWSPERETGQLVRGFVDSGGAWGNIYLLSYAHFFDYRGVGMQAGLQPGQFINGDILPEDLPMHLARNLNRRWDDMWVLNPERDLLIIYSDRDETTGDLLKAWFPTGYMLYYPTREETPWLTPEPFWVFRVPAPGREAIEKVIAQTQ